MLKGGIFVGVMDKSYKRQTISFGFGIPWGVKGKTAMPYLYG
jgi:hypothetical protein